MALSLTLAAIAGLLALAAAAIALARFAFTSRLIYGTSAVLCLAVAVAAALAIGAPSSATVLPLGLPWLGAHFRVDAIGAFFLAVINIGGAAASFYALGYGRHEPEPARILPFYAAFLAGMNLVLIADDAFSYLLAWEFMSVSSFGLVVAHHRTAENVHAGYVYLVMASFGTLCLLLAFGILAGPDGAYAFGAMRAANLSPTATALVLALALVGAGSKAGLIPLHVWLPLAHPAAPSHVSALMSGVMTKVAVYGFIRIVFDLLGPPDWWWGMAVLAAGASTAVIGVLHALMQQQLKALLAYSTVENIGIIFIGLGLTLAFAANHMDAAAAVAFTASLLHVLNHAIFKSLLFFGAGAVLTATGERDMDRLGGLIHRMPRTAFLFLVGAAAISALPPLNGFVSEWLTLQAIFLSPELPQWGLRLLVPTAGAMLALSTALAAACFVRAYGVTFLGRARGPAALAARETDAFSLLTMIVLAGFCFLIGILPGPLVDVLAPATEQIVHARMPEQSILAWRSLVPIAESRSSYNGALVFTFIAAAAGLAAFLIHRLASRAVRRAPAWDCGTPITSAQTQYTAASIAQPIRRVFGEVVFHAREHVTMPPPGDLGPARFAVEMRDPSWALIYTPLIRGIGFAAQQLNGLQFLTIRRYLTFVFLALVTLLLVLAIWS